MLSEAYSQANHGPKAVVGQRAVFSAVGWKAEMSWYGAPPVGVEPLWAVGCSRPNSQIKSVAEDPHLLPQTLRMIPLCHQM